MVKPKLRKLADNIYCLEFKNAYDLSMTFLRYQEYHESPKFRGKFFTLSDFMEWYSKKYGNGTFTYTTDYVGFNLPSEDIIRVLKEIRTSEYDMWTPYDQVMYDTVCKIIDQQPYRNPRFYLIGITNPPVSKVILPHEFAHSLYTINIEYRKQMDILLKQLPKKIWEKTVKYLKNNGYASNVYKDEAQAYLATGLYIFKNVKNIQKRLSPFKKVFKYFSKGIIK